MASIRRGEIEYEKECNTMPVKNKTKNFHLATLEMQFVKKTGNPTDLFLLLPLLVPNN